MNRPLRPRFLPRGFWAYFWIFVSIPFLFLLFAILFEDDSKGFLSGILTAAVALFLCRLVRLRHEPPPLPRPPSPDGHEKPFRDIY